ncbi:MAG: hypothetical protein ACYCOO_03230 [Chitinophagaceae bacterium]
MKFISKVGFALILLQVCGCSSKSTTFLSPPYFSIPQFMTREMIRIRNTPGPWLKIITMNGKKDSLMVSPKDSLDAFFGPFIQEDINKPAFKGMYRIENSTDPVTGDQSIRYTATGKITQPFLIQIIKGANHQVKSLYVEDFSQNILYRNSRKMLYKVGQWIQIVNYQKVILLPARNIEVKLLFQVGERRPL